MSTTPHARTPDNVLNHPVVSRQEWLSQRLALLAQEKEFTKARDAMAAKVRSLPWVKVDKAYRFESISGTKSLRDLFGSRSQLIVYHFMFDPTWSQGCHGCSFLADHYNPLVVHLAHRDISLVTVSSAPVEKLEAFKKRMGWTFPWLSAGHTDFSRDFGVSFTDEQLANPGAVYNFNQDPGPMRELPGVSVFFKSPSGEIYHTYSAYARGLEDFLTAYRFIDIAPKGRDEKSGEGMNWLRHHDRYDDQVYTPPWAERPGITSPLPKK